MTGNCASLVLLLLPLAACASPAPKPADQTAPANSIGNFSISLSVKDLAASRAFYEKLGFRAVGSHAADNYVILQNADCTIGLFQGLFERNTLTFNPGWDRHSQPVAGFEDVRALQQRWKQSGLTLAVSADEASTGPAYLMLMDPDGNPVLIDQHVPKPK
jgi:catechol 2,3-dioxygenase-like lactoylglutathione lyase family enzyme